MASPDPVSTTTKAPLDDNSVSALLSLDQAMEALAARVTPAVVNVTVTSKKSGNVLNQAEGNDDQNNNGLQQFGKQFGFNFPMVPSQPQSRVEHGLGSGVIISPDGYIVTNNHVIDGATDIRITTDRPANPPCKTRRSRPAYRSCGHQG